MRSLLTTAYRYHVLYSRELRLPLAWPAQGQENPTLTVIDVEVGPRPTRWTPAHRLKAPGLLLQLEIQRLVTRRREIVPQRGPQDRLLRRLAKARVNAAHLIEDRRHC